MKKIVLITGATRGLGKEIALQSVKAGFITLIGARSKADGEAIVKEFGAKEGLMDAIQLDVTDNDSVIAAAAYIKLQYGKLDVLVNNAGVLDFAESQKISLDVFRSTYRVNVFGVVTMIEQMSPLLRASGQGQIINVSSEVGTFSVMTNPESPYYSLSLPAYITSKSAVNAITIVASKMLAEQNIRINAVDPGFIKTDMNDHSGVRSPEEPAAEIIRMCSSTDTATGKLYSEESEHAW